MGADNWTTCPRCFNAAAVATADAIKRRDEAIGNVSANEFLALDLAAQKPVDPGRTLAENYEINMNEHGSFRVDYSAHCSKKGCGFTYKFEHETDPGDAT